jgi:hypothetical protein
MLDWGTVLRKEGNKFIVELKDNSEIKCSSKISDEDIKEQLYAKGLNRLVDKWNGFQVVVDLTGEPLIVKILADETKKDILDKGIEGNVVYDVKSKNPGLDFVYLILFEMIVITLLLLIVVLLFRKRESRKNYKRKKRFKPKLF